MHELSVEELVHRTLYLRPSLASWPTDPAHRLPRPSEARLNADTDRRTVTFVSVVTRAVEAVGPSPDLMKIANGRKLTAEMHVTVMDLKCRIADISHGNSHGLS
jgi:hypothetical protein